MAAFGAGDIGYTSCTHKNSIGTNDFLYIFVSGLILQGTLNTNLQILTKFWPSQNFNFDIIKFWVESKENNTSDIDPLIIFDVKRTNLTIFDGFSGIQKYFSKNPSGMAI